MMNRRKTIPAVLLLLGLFLSLSLPAPAAEGEAAAYRCSRWAEAEMAQAIGLGFVPEDLLGDCTQPVTRRDFARIALRFVSELQYGFRVGTGLFAEAYCRAGGIEPAQPFADAPEEELTQARSVGLVNGRSDTEYDPDSGITRQEAALILRRVYGCYGDPEAVDAASDYADAGEIAAWASPGVDFVTAAGVMQGVGEGRFDPLGPYTLEQCVVTFLRLYASAPMSRKTGTVAPLASREELTGLLLSQEMAGTPIELLEKHVLPDCTVLFCHYPDFRQPLEYLYLVSDGGVRDALAEASPPGSRYAELGDLRSRRFEFSKDFDSLTVRAEYASGAVLDYRFRLTGDGAGERIEAEEIRPPAAADVPTDAWFYADAAYCLERGLMQVNTELVFGPEEPVTQAQLLDAMASVYRYLATGQWSPPAPAGNAGRAVIIGEDGRELVSFLAWETGSWRTWAGPMNKDPYHYSIAASEEAVRAAFPEPDEWGTGECAAVLDMGDKLVSGRLVGTLSGDLEESGPAFLFYPEETSGYKDGGLLEPGAPTPAFRSARPAEEGQGGSYFTEKGIPFLGDLEEDTVWGWELASFLHLFPLTGELPESVFEPIHEIAVPEGTPYGSYLEPLYRAGILPWENENWIFDPYAPVTRAQLAVVLHRLLDASARS